MVSNIIWLISLIIILVFYILIYRNIRFNHNFIITIAYYKNGINHYYTTNISLYYSDNDSLFIFFLKKELFKLDYIKGNDIDVNKISITNLTKMN